MRTSLGDGEGDLLPYRNGEGVCRLIYTKVRGARWLGDGCARACCAKSSAATQKTSTPNATEAVCSTKVLRISIHTSFQETEEERVFRPPAPLANEGSLQGLLGEAHPPRGTIFVVTSALLTVANFSERR